MRKLKLEIEVDVPDGGEAAPEHLYTALESALGEAARDPAPFLSRLTPVIDTTALPGDPVHAEIYSDDRVVEASVDIRPYLMEASVEDLNTLILDGWAYAESADQIAYALCAAGDPDAVRLFDYLSTNPRGLGNDQVGFAVSADGGEALAWLEVHRPEVHAQLDLIIDGPEVP